MYGAVYGVLDPFFDWPRVDGLFVGVRFWEGEKDGEEWVGKVRELCLLMRAENIE